MDATEGLCLSAVPWSRVAGMRRIDGEGRDLGEIARNCDGEWAHVVAMGRRRTRSARRDRAAEVVRLSEISAPGALAEPPGSGWQD